MSTAFLVAALAGALVTGTLGTLACRNRNCFLSNFLAAAVGAFALTMAAKQIGVGYSDFGVDLGTGMVFAMVGGLVALLFATMLRELSQAEPAEKQPQPRYATKPTAHISKVGKRSIGDQQQVCADFHLFLQGNGGFPPMAGGHWPSSRPG